MFFFLTLFIVQDPTSFDVAQTDQIVTQIFEKEKDRRTRCRMNDQTRFDHLSGRPLDDEAQMLMHQILKKLSLTILMEAQDRVTAGEAGIAAVLPTLLDSFLKVRIQESGDYVFRFENGVVLRISRVQIDELLSEVHNLHILLGLQQEAMTMGIQLPGLESNSIRLIDRFLCLAQLAVQAIASDQRINLSRSHIRASQVQKWANSLLGIESDRFAKHWSAWHQGLQEMAKNHSGEPDFLVVHRLCQQKIQNYEPFGQVAMTTFVRDLQVFFARHPWPDDSSLATAFRLAFGRHMREFAKESLVLAQKYAVKRGHGIIRETDLHEALSVLLPSRRGFQDESVLFPGTSVEVPVEIFDRDSFMETGVPWQYLETVFIDHQTDFDLSIEPLALDQAVLAMTDFGLGLLRLAGRFAAEAKAEMLSVSHLEFAFAMVSEAGRSGFEPTSSKQPGHEDAESTGLPFYRNVTGQTGIQMRHAPADWISRLLRSPIMRKKDLAILTIPPVFEGSGMALGQLNGDDQLDILFLSGTGNRLYFGGKDGVFLADRSGTLNHKRVDGTFHEPRQALIADFDNDGMNDVVITYALAEHQIWKNHGEGRFENLSRQANLGGLTAMGGPAIVFDANQDGLLDLVVGSFPDVTKGLLPGSDLGGVSSLDLFINKGDFKFERSHQSGLEWVGAWVRDLWHSDINGDGLQDVIACNAFGPDAMFMAQGDGSFKPVELEGSKVLPTTSLQVVDWNQDGNGDILSFSSGRLKSEPTVDGEINAFLSSKNKGLMDSIEVKSLVDGVGGWALNCGDIDNDGHQDLVLEQGENPYQTGRYQGYIVTDPESFGMASVHMFLNRKSGLESETQMAMADGDGFGRSSIFLDLDRDGDLDWIRQPLLGNVQIYSNERPSMGNWLAIELRGDPEQQCNMNAIGSKIRVTGKWGKLVGYREVHSGGGGLAMGPLIQHFGLGELEKVRLEITWPNGAKQTLKNVSANQYLTIQQNQK